MVNTKTKKTVKSTGSSPGKKTSKQKLSAKKTTAGKKQQKAKKSSKKTTGKKATTKVAAKRKSTKENSSNGVYKAKNNLKVRRTNVNELKKVENVIERLSQRPKTGARKTATVVRKTVPGVLRIVHDVQDKAPNTPKVVPIVEIKSYFKKLLVGSNA